MEKIIIMASVTVEKIINAPRETVFAKASDFESAANMVSDIVEVEILTEGPIGKGTRFKETRIFWGKKATEIMEIVAFEPNSSYQLQANSHGARYLTTFNFVAEGEATKVSMFFEATPLSFFAKVMSIFSKAMMNSVRKAVEKDLDDLKKACEEDS